MKSDYFHAVREMISISRILNARPPFAISLVASEYSRTLRDGDYMATADDIEEGFYRYPDLKAKKYVSSRSDLHDKQKKLGFPLPAKPSPKVALFLKTEVHAWWLAILAKRDAEHLNSNTCKQIEMARAVECDARRHARLISQASETDAGRDDKPRKGILHHGMTIDK